MSEVFDHNCIGYIVHPAKDDAPSIYRWIIHYLQNGHKVVYAAEAIPDLAIGKLSEMNREVRQYIKNGMLKVVDPEFLHLRHRAMAPTTNEAIADEWLAIIRNMKVRSKRSSAMIISTPELLGGDQKLETLQAVSEEMGRRCSGRVEVVCCYSLEWFSSLNLGHAISLRSMNERNLRRYEFLDDATSKFRILSVISRALDYSLGKGSGRLILTTLSFLHNMDQTDLLADPYWFETKLRRLIGKAADRIIPVLLNALRDDMILSQQYLMGRPNVAAQ